MLLKETLDVIESLYGVVVFCFVAKRNCRDKITVDKIPELQWDIAEHVRTCS